APPAGEGDRRLPGPDEERDHRRPRRAERRGRRDDARSPGLRRRRRDDRPVPPAEPEARHDRPLGAPGRVPLVPGAGRGARLRLGVLRAARALELPGGRAAPRGGNRPRRRRVLSPDPPLASVPKMGHTALRWRFRYPELRDVFDKFVAAVRRGRSERQVKKGLIAAAAVVALLIAAAGGAVNAKSASAKVPVPQGISALLLTNTAKHGGSSPPVFPIDNQTPANTPEDVTFVLDIQNRHQLESLVSNNMNGRFLSVDQFARSFGQSRQNIDALQSYLKHYGITTNVMADGLDVQANGTAQ